MPERHLLPDLEQVRRFGGVGCLDPDVEVRCGPKKEERITERLGGGEDQQPLGIPGESVELTPIARLQARRQ